MKVDMDKVQKWQEKLEKVMTETAEYTTELAKQYEEKSQTFRESDEGMMVEASIDELSNAVDVLQDVLGHMRQVSA